VICCGYKGYVIKEYFANYFLHMSDITFNMKLYSIDKPVNIMDQRDDGATRNRYIPDISKVERELGHKVTVPLSEAISRFRNHPMARAGSSLGQVKHDLLGREEGMN
jgi:hypothetical protein